MENHHHHLLLLLLLPLLLTTLITTTTPQPISPPPSSPSPSPPPPPPTTTTSTTAETATALEQLNNIIDALIGASDFTTWLSILSNPTTTLPLTATLFIPHDTTFFNNNHSPPPMDPFLFAYHVVPQKLTFSDLLLFPSSTRLPTLLPDKSISITHTSADNFSLDYTQLTHPDLYTTPSLVVHGIAHILDYSLFGNAIIPAPPSTPLSQQPNKETPLLQQPFWLKKSSAAGGCTFCLFFLIVCWFLVQQVIIAV
ncbi:hypothetical protein RIF29_27259 [Crotalaria pallida]|uniref:FAS1 domain-containing protein n=1 Tax=Crotalaria pallida TaxID=3830 RepID=A0AAN9ENR3_CROPI